MVFALTDFLLQPLESGSDLPRNVIEPQIVFVQDDQPSVGHENNVVLLKTIEKRLKSIARLGRSRELKFSY